MLNFYKKQRIKEAKIKMESKYDAIPNCSVLVLAKHSDFEESFFDTLGNKRWAGIASEMFTYSIANLLISGKINAVYFADKKSILSDLLVFQSEGFLISPAEHPVIDEEDILANDVLSVLSENGSNQKAKVSAVVKRVIDIYIETGSTKRPEKKFFYAYLNVYAKKYTWLKLEKNNKLFGLITNYNIVLDPDKKSDLVSSCNEFEKIKFQLRRKNVLFRNFLTHIDQIVADDFISRYPGD